MTRTGQPMSKAERQSYNLPGFGLLSAWIFPYTRVLYGFLSRYRHDVRFHHTNQLGPIRNILHGVHHSRYEYIFTQWTLISELKTQGIGDPGLNSAYKEFGKLPGFDKYPTAAEVLQCLVLLTNMGHLPETFAASRAWLHRLRTDENTLAGFRGGLAREDKKILDEALRHSSDYQIHLLNAAFLLQRYKRAGGKNADFVSFGEKLLRAFLTRGSRSDDEKTEKLWLLYSNVRRASSLILDSHYAPVPFSLDLASIMLNFKNLSEDFLVRRSPFQSALQQLEMLLLDSVHMSGDSLLAAARSTEQTLERINRADVAWDRVGAIKSVLAPTQGNGERPAEDRGADIFNTPLQFRRPDWDRHKTIQLTYDNIADPELIASEDYSSLFPTDVVEWSTTRRKSISKRRCRVAATLNPHGSIFRAVYALSNDLPDRIALVTALRIVHEALRFEFALAKGGYSGRNSLEQGNRERMLLFLLKSIFGWNTVPNLRPLPTRGSATPLFVERGSRVMAEAISDYMQSLDTQISSDNLHELRVTCESVRRLNYNGPIVCFLGSTEIESDANTAAEFDGVLLFPAMDPCQKVAVIVEAKNRRNGHSLARKQLTQRLQELCPSYMRYEVEDVHKKGAYATLRLYDSA